MDITKYADINKQTKTRATFTLDRKVFQEFGEVINKIKDTQNIKLNKSMLVENIMKKFIQDFEESKK